MSKPDGAHPFLAVLIAVTVVAALSLVPWSRLTGGIFKDYDLLADVKTKSAQPKKSTANYVVDEALTQAVNSIPDTVKTAKKQVAATEAPRIDDNVIIEDFTPGAQGLMNFRRALASRTNRPARIAVIGDSYIEGDILTMHLRQALQDDFGGSGVGYVALSNPIAGFRSSVRQSDQGWTISDIKHSPKAPNRWLAGEYCTTQGPAHTQYRGTKSLRHLDSWTTTKLAFVSPNPGNVEITLGDDAQPRTYQINGAADSLQFITIHAPASKVKIATDIAGLQALGAWLEGNNGVQLDNMSLRGYSGIAHRNIDAALTAQLRQFVDYDLIIIEYGINAISAGQENYDGYGYIMGKVIDHLRKCYPRADILMLGVGDRAERIDGQVQSLPEVTAMVNTQRATAQKAGCLFWDMREAMGGEGTAAHWRDKKLMNADYIHLNAQGGQQMADMLYTALKYAIK